MRALLARVYYALGPLAAGILLDVLDLATWGPVGIAIGAVVGAYAGWIIGGFEGLSRDGRVTLAVCAALYMMIPMTETLPIATAFTLIARFMKGPRQPDDPDRGDTE